MHALINYPFVYCYCALGIALSLVYGNIYGLFISL